MNLLTTPLSEPELAAVLDRHRDARLWPAWADPTWTAIFAKPPVSVWQRQLRTLAEAEADVPLPPLTDELYRLYQRTGNRTAFETVYFERRQRLARAVLAALAEPAAWSRWECSVTAKAKAIFEEESWALPAHVDDPSGRDPQVIDLFAAETANLFGDLLQLFGAVWPQELTARIRARLRHSIFENYFSRQWWWQSVTHNWNAVCHQGVLGAALAVEDDAALVARLLSRARECLRRFLDGFTRDGGCTEGARYWQYGFGRFMELNLQLETRTGGELSLVTGNTALPRIARFGPDMSLSEGQVVNFADAGRVGPLAPWLLTELGERFGDPICCELARANYQWLATHGVDWYEQRADLFSLMRLFWRCPAALGEPVILAPRDVAYPDLAVVVVRSHDAHGNLWEWAAKGGHNAEHHNHNDCGSYLVQLNGRPIVEELGMPQYEKGYFSDRRYEFLSARTRGHSLPVINGCEQAAGREFAARVLVCELTDTAARFELDLTACYPAAARCRRVRRAFRFDKSAGVLTVTDTVELTEPGTVETALITTTPVVWEAGHPRIDDAVVRATDEARWAGCETLAYRPRYHEDTTVYRLVLQPTAPAARVRLAYTISHARTLTGKAYMAKID